MKLGSAARLFCQFAAPVVKSLMHGSQRHAAKKISIPFRPSTRRNSPALLYCWVVILTLGLTASLAPAQTATTTNRALKLDGNGSYVALPPDIFQDLTQATVEAWARWADFGAFSRIFEFGAGWQSVSLFNHSTNSDLRFNIYPRYAKADPSSMFTATAKGLLRTNEWVHLAAVSGPGGMLLYANGRLVAQHTNTTSFADIHVTQTNLLGRGLARNPTDRDFRGEIDEVRVWDHRRSLAEIRENMFKRLIGTEEGLTHLWNFDDGTANDSGPNFHHGKLMGKARVGRVDLDLALAVIAIPTPHLPPVVAASTNLPPAIAASAVPVVVTAPANESKAVWWIAGALVALVVLLAWLVLMLRRSGLGSAKLLSSGPTHAALSAGESITPPGIAAAQTDKELKERALADLTDFAKQSLVQGLYSQRAALLATHQQVQQELAELETRVVALRLPERIQAYEKRITELEGELETRSDEVRELTLATLHVLRQKLEEEKLKEAKPRSFN